ncbi:hypothetical protein C8R42DRAFT_150938 [Lentinula raphanica]|nr:hypothetical protein C8R42DRAFT_150938 [Lentinula raphanica]
MLKLPVSALATFMSIIYIHLPCSPVTNETIENYIHVRPHRPIFLFASSPAFSALLDFTRSASLLSLHLQPVRLQNHRSTFRTTAPSPEPPLHLQNHRSTICSGYLTMITRAWQRQVAIASTTESIREP